MSNISRAIRFTAAAAILSGLMGFAAAAQANPTFAGVIVVPASANPMQDDSAAGKTAPAPRFRRARIVAYDTAMAAGSIIVDTREHSLYFVLGDGLAARYRVATGRPGFEWSGVNHVSAKTTWPTWRPPVEMRQRHPELPEFMAGGPENPLGARAIYLGSTMYRIHGTNDPASIGKSASSGCIRMLNEDVSELYQFVKVGASVTVL
jgi:lipoprotein-anchoring transpeptidase ErfK/SrfK